jgi:uncharacterized protein (DUF2147 family)
MGSLKLQSFEDFAAASKAAAEAKIQEEQKAARTESAYKFETLLNDFGVTSVKDLNEEDRNKFFAKLAASEVSESLAIIEEGTRSQVGIINKRGKIESVYMHYDGYPDHMLPTIKKGYMNPGAVKGLLKKGGGSFLEADPSKINFYGDKQTLKGDAKNVDKYMRDANYDGGAEFVYLYDERDGKWYMADVYGDAELIPAFESLVINEKFVPSKGNTRDAKKVAKTLEGIMMEGSALTADSTTHLGAIKYLTMNALEDANFHSYIEPIGKKLGGKIRTVMITVDNLGGLELPVGAKTIKRFLDDNYSKLSSAAGWSGIGIVEGVALYLDGWGLSKQAQAIVDQFNLIFQNEAVVAEGNAFLAARAKAIEEDAEEFEFNGKTFPVIKEDAEVEEVSEGMHPKIKKAMKAVEKGETVYGENIRFPGRFKILNIDKGGFATVDYMDGTDPMQMASMNIAIDSLSFESAEIEEGNAFGAARAEAIAKGDDKFKVGDEEYDVEGVDAEDKENAEEYAEEEGIEVKEEEVAEEGVTNEAKVKSGQRVMLIGQEGNEKTKWHGEVGIITKDGKSVKLDKTGNTFELGDKWRAVPVRESVNEAEVKSDEDFKEYAFSVLGQAFGDKFDEEKAQEVVDGLLDKHGDDYGAAVGALQASLG